MSKSREERWVVDSLEEGVARVERGGEALLHIPADWLPSGTREGDILQVSLRGGREEAALSFSLDREATEQARSEVRAQTERLGATDGGGDLVL